MKRPMKLTLDTETRTLTIVDGDGERTFDPDCRPAFQALSHQWVWVGSTQKVQYTFSPMGRPMIPQSEDVLRMQRVIFTQKPDVSVDTGIAHGGSLIRYSSPCKAMGKGRVVGVDIEIGAHDRTAIEAHPLSDRITMIGGPKPI